MTNRPRKGSPPGPSLLRLVIVAILVGATAGLGGLALGLLLHLTQHLAFGYGFDAGSAHESFLGISRASPVRRVLVLTLSGAIAGIGWWSIERFGSPLVSIARTVSKSAGLRRRRSNCDQLQELIALRTECHANYQLGRFGVTQRAGRTVIF